MIKKGEVLVEKMSEEARMLVYRMGGEGFTLRATLDEVKTQFGIEMTVEGIRQVMLTGRGKQMVKKFRDDYMNAVKDVPIANKRIRIDDLEKIREKLLKELEDIKITGTNRYYFLTVIKRLTETIAAARDEMENRLGMVNNIVMGNFSDRTDDELRAERDEILRNFRRIIPREDADSGRNQPGIEGTSPKEPS